MLLLHPNGFCAGFFDPLARRLAADGYHPIGVDLRGHGGTGTPAQRAELTFARMAADVVAVLDHLGIERFFALGESLGGGVAVLVDAQRPGATQRLMLCEAIVFDPAALGRGPRPGEAPGDGGNYMATIARKRRGVWPDRATVRHSYGSRPPLDALAPEALDAYLRWGFVDRPDGQVELACDPEVEAMIFEASSGEGGALAAWRELDALSCPAVVLAGARSELPHDWFRGQADRARAPFVAIEGGHFFLHEDTERAETLVREHLAVTGE